MRHRLLICATDVNLLEDNMDTVMKNTETNTSKEG
jgi:hypothetical protein